MFYRAFYALTLLVIGFSVHADSIDKSILTSHQSDHHLFWQGATVKPLMLAFGPEQNTVTVRYTHLASQAQTLYLQASYAHISKFELNECLNHDCSVSRKVAKQSTNLPARIPTISAMHQVGTNYLLNISVHRMSSEVVVFELSANSTPHHWLARDKFSLTYVALMSLIGLIGLIYGYHFFGGLSVYYAGLQLCVISVSLLYYGFAYELGVFTPQLTIMFIKLLLPISALCLLHIGQEILITESSHHPMARHFRWMILTVQLSIPLMLFDNRWLELSSLSFIAFCIAWAGWLSWVCRKEKSSSAKLLLFAYILTVIGFVGDMAIHSISPNGLGAAQLVRLQYLRDHFFSVVSLINCILVYYLFLAYLSEEKQKSEPCKLKLSSRNRLSNHSCENKILLIIDQHLHDKEFAVEGLAERLHVSVSTANRLMRKHFSCSPAAMIKQRRMLRAAELVENSECRSIIELSLQVGYADSGYFAKQYRNVFGQDAL